MARFRTRARTVDMLGRQQIAGIPTAISELFKNAHDAYADRVEADFFRRDRLLVLRDDGIGMSRQDFEQRWLTLGTESKVPGDSGKIGPLFHDPSKPQRPVLGEKGIGRLAIAAIGPQVLVLTRAKAFGGSTADLVVAFLHWGLFRLPGVDLEQIEIPLRVLPGGHLPDLSLVKELAAETRRNLDAVSGSLPTEAVLEIQNDLSRFSVDPQALALQLAGPTLAQDGHGTHFYINTDDALEALLESPGEDDIAPPLHKMLLGFTNTMTPGHPEPVIKTAFRDHRSPDTVDDVIEESEFFTPYEFENADHHLSGTFDEFGQFRGTVAVFGEPTENYVVPWPARAKPTECGPFRINLAVIQGVASQSTLPSEDWARMTRKMTRIGGLYIYRDGIRVLPYGNNDYDFLDIERNRTKSAYYYYFSYRRIFGVIEITRATNIRLHEKAGREGFRENRAYRQFRDILKNFFVQVAADFFREDSSYGRYEARRVELSRLEKAKRRRDKQVSVRRKAFRETLTAKSADLAGGAGAQRVADTISALDHDLRLAGEEPDPDRSATAFIQAESSARRGLNETREEFRLSAPRGVGLPAALRRDFEAYRQEYEHFIQTVCDPAVKDVEHRINAATSKAQVVINRRLRFESALDELTATATKDTQAESQTARSAADEARLRVGELARASMQQVERVVGDVLSRAATVDVSQLDDDAFVTQRGLLEADVERASTDARRVLGSVAEQLRTITEYVRTSAEGAVPDTTILDAEEALEEEVIALRERSEADLELAQLGIAIQVINHEFDATIRTVRKNIRQLRAWADANEKLRELYESIRDSFSHLDGYLTLFTPLQRRIYRSAVRITGADIFRFLEDLFEERLKRHGVRLVATPGFRAFALTGYPSTFYPVFVNLLDNAIYWVTRRDGDRTIRLGTLGDSLLIEDSGPGIEGRDREAIFEFGFSRKPSGRGLGLHISRQVLDRSGYRLDLRPERGDLGGAVFVISPASESGAGTADVTQ